MASKSGSEIMDLIFHVSCRLIMRNCRCRSANARTADSTSLSSFRSHSRSANHSFTIYLVPSSAVDNSSPSEFLTYWSAFRVSIPSKDCKTASSNSRRFTLPRYSFKSRSPRSVSRIQDPRPLRSTSTRNPYVFSASSFQSITILSPHILL